MTEAKRINQAYEAGYLDGLVAQRAAASAVHRSSCHWCGQILVGEDAGEHVPTCEQNPHREKFEMLEALYHVLERHMVEGETALQTAQRLATFVTQWKTTDKIDP